MEVSQVAKVISDYYAQLRVCEALSKHDKEMAKSLTRKKKHYGQVRR